jgi:hypothetical protein
MRRLLVGERQGDFSSVSRMAFTADIFSSAARDSFV